MVKLKLQYFGHLMWRVDSLEKTLMLGGIGAGGEGTTEDEMAGWHHWLDGHESEWTLGVGDGQGGLACCDSWGCKESDTTERLNWTELKKELISSSARVGRDSLPTPLTPPPIHPQELLTECLEGGQEICILVPSTGTSELRATVEKYRQLGTLLLWQREHLDNWKRRKVTKRKKCDWSWGKRGKYNSASLSQRIG